MEGEESENEKEKENNEVHEQLKNIKGMSKRIPCKITKTTVSKSYNKNNRKESKGSNQVSIQRNTLQE